MTLTQKRLLILLVIAVVAFVLGRLVVRVVMNLLIGGTLSGRNFLRERTQKSPLSASSNRWISTANLDVLL